MYLDIRRNASAIPKISFGRLRVYETMHGGYGYKSIAALLIRA